MLVSRSFRTPALNYIIGLERNAIICRTGAYSATPRVLWVLVVTRGVLLHSPVSLPPISFRLVASVCIVYHVSSRSR